MRNDDELTPAFPVKFKQNAGRGDDPSDLLRTIHTISGLCGFIGFSTLIAITRGAGGEGR